MTRHENEILAKQLVTMLTLSRASAASAHMGIGVDDPDISGALLAEVEHLAREDPDLRGRIHGQIKRGQRQSITDALTDKLDSDTHATEVLTALMGGGDHDRHTHNGKPTGWRKHIRASYGRMRTFLVEGGWVARKVAAVWISVLIAVPVAIVFFILWSDLGHEPEPDELAVLLLKGFAVWCLSFLPGWLYVRFLGQRAGALWNEYVLHLHRLGWDEPQFLPRPPISSEFFSEWLRRGGPVHQHKQSLYRQKFDAYYGKAVADNMQRTNFAVKTDTMFPVFVATALLATCWTATLWDTSFIENPSSVWDVLKFAFLGAYAFVAQSLVRRFFQSDLRPSAYAAAILRIVFVLLTVAALHQIMGFVDYRTEAAVAFVVGLFPVIALQALHRLAATVLRVVVPQLTPEYPLNQLDGLNVWYEARLLEEGIEDMENLATANLIDVILHTRVPVGRLVDWVDQATLYLHLDRVERGWGERRFVRRARKIQQEVALNAARHDAQGRQADEGTTSKHADPRNETSTRVEGSTNPALRAGTHTRVALRQLGIRTATDLLKAFPPDQADPVERGEPSGRRKGDFKHLFPEGLDKECLDREGLDESQIRILVRVLSQNTNLAAVWNWQSRGVKPRDEQRGVLVISRARRAASIGGQTG
jgi:hypothetical protein